MLIAVHITKYFVALVGEGELHYCFSASLALRCRSLRVDKLAYKERSNGQAVLRLSVRLFICPSVYL